MKVSELVPSLFGIDLKSLSATKSTVGLCFSASTLVGFIKI